MNSKKQIIDKPQKTGYQVVEEKVRIANGYVKNLDMEQLNRVVEQVRMNVVKQ